MTPIGGLTLMLPLSLLAPLLLVAPAAPPSCTDLLEGLRAKVETNYAGYMLEVAPARAGEYARLVAGLREEAARVDQGDCFPVLARYVAWFEDPHLFVLQSTRIDSAETVQRQAEVRRVDLTEAAVRRSVAARGAAADPVEGIWHDRALRLGVIPDPDGTADRFVAVVLASDTATFQPGFVHAVFDRRGAGYDVSLRWRSHAVTRPPVSLHRGGTLLRLSPAMWAKDWPVPEGERARPDTADARRPTFALVEGVPVVALPSHQYQYRAVLDSIIAASRDVLASAEYLVVDLRGNEGGGSLMSAGLLPYIVGDPGADSARVDDAPVMLSSPDQVRYARRAFGPDTSAFVRRLVGALEAAPGELVPLFDSAAPAPTRPDPAPIHGPRRVAVLVDGGTVSAAEVLVLVARRSSRAVVIGEPTAGALDYQSTSIVPIHPEERRWYLGYPTITAHAGLPTGGMRGTGIAPERRLAWATVQDPVAAAMALLRVVAE